MDAHNNEHAQQVLLELMQTFGVGEQELVDFMYNLKTVKTHGYGHVQITVFNGHVQKVEALLRTLRAVEGEEKKG